jgi:hypothetical protein
VVAVRLISWGGLVGKEGQALAEEGQQGGTQEWDSSQAGTGVENCTAGRKNGECRERPACAARSVDWRHTSGSVGAASESVRLQLSA